MNETERGEGLLPQTLLFDSTYKSKLMPAELEQNPIALSILRRHLKLRRRRGLLWGGCSCSWIALSHLVSASFRSGFVPRGARPTAAKKRAVLLRRCRCIRSPSSGSTANAGPTCLYYSISCVICLADKSCSWWLIRDPSANPAKLTPRCSGFARVYLNQGVPLALRRGVFHF